MTDLSLENPCEIKSPKFTEDNKLAIFIDDEHLLVHDNGKKLFILFKLGDDGLWIEVNTLGTEEHGWMKYMSYSQMMRAAVAVFDNERESKQRS